MPTLTALETTATIHQDGCGHNPPCPPATAPDRNAAKVVFRDYRVGFSLLCNGVEVFDDTGEILPDRSTIAPHRPERPHRKAARLETPRIALERTPARALDGNHDPAQVGAVRLDPASSLA